MDMTKRMAFAVLALWPAFAFAQDYDAAQRAALKEVADQICGCLDDFDPAGKQPADLQGKLQACVQEASIAHTQTLVNAFGPEEMQDQNFAARIGLEMQRMLINDCERMQEITMEMGASMQPPAPAAANGSVTGKASGPEQGTVARFTVTSSDGSATKLFLLRRFSGAERLLKAGPDLSSETHTFRYREIEIYLPEANGFVTVKELTGVD